MDVRIGVIRTTRELDLEMPEDTDPVQLQNDIDAALMGEGGVLWLTDRRDRRVGVPVDRIAYVEISSPDSQHRIGFGG